MSRQAAEASGRFAEAIAANFLRLKGWSILDRRVRTPAGEIDIVMRKAGIVAFVEVKSRKDDAALDLALDRRRLVRVAAAAEYLIPRYAKDGDDIRIDAVLIAPGRLPGHLEHVWQGLRYDCYRPSCCRWGRRYACSQKGGSVGGGQASIRRRFRIDNGLGVLRKAGPDSRGGRCAKGRSRLPRPVIPARNRNHHFIRFDCDWCAFGT